MCPCRWYNKWLDYHLLLGIEQFYIYDRTLKFEKLLKTVHSARPGDLHRIPAGQRDSLPRTIQLDRSVHRQDALSDAYASVVWMVEHVGSRRIPEHLFGKAENLCTTLWNSREKAVSLDAERISGKIFQWILQHHYLRCEFHDQTQFNHRQLARDNRLWWSNSFSIDWPNGMIGWNTLFRTNAHRGHQYTLCLVYHQQFDLRKFHPESIACSESKSPDTDSPQSLSNRLRFIVTICFLPIIKVRSNTSTTHYCITPLGNYKSLKEKQNWCWRREIIEDVGFSSFRFFSMSRPTCTYRCFQNDRVFLSLSLLDLLWEWWARPMIRHASPILVNIN